MTKTRVSGSRESENCFSLVSLIILPCVPACFLLCVVVS